jgi:hypothetical protein
MIGFLARYATTLAIVVMTGVLIFLARLQTHETTLLLDFASRSACEALERRVEAKEALISIIQNQRATLKLFQGIARQNVRRGEESSTETLVLINRALRQNPVPEPASEALVQKTRQVCNAAQELDIEEKV